MKIITDPKYISMEYSGFSLWQRFLIAFRVVHGGTVVVHTKVDYEFSFRSPKK